MNRKAKSLLLVLAATLLILSPLILQAQGELSLESLASRISNLQDGHNRQEQSLSHLLDRIRKLEVEVRSLQAPTATPSPNATLSAKETATAAAAVTRVRMTATARAQKSKATATAVSHATSRARATANARPRATATPFGCNLPDVPEPPQGQRVNCESWGITYKLISLATGGPVDHMLQRVRREFYPLVVDASRHCRVSPTRLGDLVYAASIEMERLGKPSSGISAIGYLLGGMSNPAFGDIVREAGNCEDALTLIVLMAE